ncbi:MAG: VWA domain-containing protein [Kofleriaceae bacterium]|nr:VWA domain-containing protein [Kofleriaceae bacterium]
MLLWSSLAACGSAHKATTPTNRPSQPLAAAPADPNLVTMTAESTTALVTASSLTELGLRVRIVGKALPDANRPPLNLGLVLDTSGSMEGKPIEALRASAKALVGKLRDGDRLSVIAFHSRADVLVNSASITADTRKQIDKAIDGIQARGTTDLAAGLAQGLSQVVSYRMPAGINRIVLLSDGVPNTNVQLPGTIAAIQQNGISVTSLGLGIDYDTQLMTQIARDTGGAFHYLDEPESIAAVFDEELSKMTTVVARNVQLTIEAGPGVAFQPMPGLTNVGNGKFTAVIGDLAAGEVRDLMFPVKVTARGDGSTVELALATLAFDDVIGKSGIGRREAFVSTKASSDAAATAGAVKIGLEVARIRATAAGATLEAITLARQGQVEPARKRIADAIKTVKAAASRLKDEELEQLGRELDGLAKDLAKIVVPQQQIIGDTQPPRADMPLVPATAPAPIEHSLRKAEQKASNVVRGARN